jgi:hypothetical protein
MELSDTVSLETDTVSDGVATLSISQEKYVPYRCPGKTPENARGLKFIEKKCTQDELQSCGSHLTNSNMFAVKGTYPMSHGYLELNFNSRDFRLDDAPSLDTKNEITVISWIANMTFLVMPTLPITNATVSITNPFCIGDFDMKEMQEDKYGNWVTNVTITHPVPYRSFVFNRLKTAIRAPDLFGVVIKCADPKYAGPQPQVMVYCSFELVSDYVFNRKTARAYIGSYDWLLDRPGTDYWSYIATWFEPAMKLLKSSEQAIAEEVEVKVPPNSSKKSGPKKVGFGTIMNFYPPDVPASKSNGQVARRRAGGGRR